MQVDRKPSRWPYVVTLVYLAILCLTVPRYWRSAEEARAQRTGKSGTSQQGVVDLYGPNPWDGWSLPGTEPSAEELIANLNSMNAQRMGDVHDPFGMSPDSPANVTWPGTTPLFGSAASDELIAAALRHVGRQIAEMSPGELTLLVPHKTEPVEPAASDRPEGSAAVKLRFAAPQDRYAMTPLRSPGSKEPVRIPPQRPAATEPPLRTAKAATAMPTGMPCPWSSPVSLMQQLALLSTHPYTASWARETAAHVKWLTTRDRLQGGQAAVMLDRLRTLSDEAALLAGETPDDVVRAELLRAHWGLERRLDCWSPMRAIATRSTADRRMASRSSVLSNFGITPGQVVDAVDLESLSADLEAYEITPSPRLAMAIRQKQRVLRTTSDVDQLALANAVDEHYRNANVRIAVTEEMLNRLVARERTETRPVHERIAGTPVVGRSMTVAESRVELVPDDSRLRIGLETDGTVASRTHTEGGPATLRSRGTTNFTARKPIVVGADGVVQTPSDAYAENHNRVVGVQTYFDWIPFLGSYVRSRAMEQYCQKRPYAQAEVEYKVASRARRRLDSEAGGRIEEAESNFRHRVTEPLEQFGVKLEPVELQTTEDRLVARIRVAGDDHLGSHTPRPTAPSDSLASVQLHETALNNAALALELNGQRLTAPQLRARLQEKFPSLQTTVNGQPAEELPADTIFQFAEHDAVEFHLKDGVVDLTLSVAEMVHGGDRMRNFIVHANYRPEVRGLEAELVRDGALGIEGRLGAGERARLHNIFNEVLSADRRLPIVRLNENVDAQLEGLVITQLVVEDGWMGLAIGPASEGRVAELTRSLR